MSKHQKLMDQAYKKWGENQSYIEFVDSLTEQEQLAVLTGNLNYQVENGGFYQWNMNHYSEGGSRLIKVLRKYKKEEFDIVVDIVENVLDVCVELDELEQERDNIDAYDYEGMMYWESDMEMLERRFDGSDNRYDEISEAFLEEVERQLQSM